MLNVLALTEINKCGDTSIVTKQYPTSNNKRVGTMTKHQRLSFLILAFGV
jgi:hypothetical protein